MMDPLIERTAAFMMGPLSVQPVTLGCGQAGLLDLRINLSTGWMIQPLLFTFSVMIGNQVKGAMQTASRAIESIGTRMGGEMYCTLPA